MKIHKITLNTSSGLLKIEPVEAIEYDKFYQIAIYEIYKTQIGKVENFLFDDNIIECWQVDLDLEDFKRKARKIINNKLTELFHQTGQLENTLRTLKAGQKCKKNEKID